MRRLKLTIGLLLIVGMMTIPSKINTVTKTATAASSPCSTAEQACAAQYNAEVQMCDELPGESFTDCVCRAMKIYNSCVVAHGCPGLKWDLEHSGCSDN